MTKEELSVKIGIGDFKVSARMRRNVEEVLQSGRLSYGKFSERFENEFARMHGRRFGVLSNSGTSSLLVALQAMKEIYCWPDGAEVVVPALTFVATVNVVLQSGLVPILVDVRPDTYNMDSRGLEKVLSSKTVAVLPVHMFGQPASMLTIQERVPDNVAVIEDSCESAFVACQGKMVGGWGDVACFSFYVAHLLTTGVGGISLTDDETTASVMRSLVNHGRNNAYLRLEDSSDPSVVDHRFQFDRIGHSFRITELEAAIGVAQLEESPEQSIIAPRRKNFEHLVQKLRAKTVYQLPTIRSDVGNAAMMFPLICPHIEAHNNRRDRVVRFLEECGIETRPLMPLMNQPAYGTRFRDADVPVARRLSQNGFYVGCHQHLDVKELDFLVEKLIEANNEILA